MADNQRKVTGQLKISATSEMFRQSNVHTNIDFAVSVKIL